MGKKRVFYVIEAKTFENLQDVKRLLGMHSMDSVQQERLEAVLDKIIKDIAVETGRAHAKKIMDGRA